MARPGLEPGTPFSVSRKSGRHRSGAQLLLARPVRRDVLKDRRTRVGRFWRLGFALDMSAGRLGTAKPSADQTNDAPVVVLRPLSCPHASALDLRVTTRGFGLRFLAGHAG